VIEAKRAVLTIRRTVVPHVHLTVSAKYAGTVTQTALEFVEKGGLILSHRGKKKFHLSRTEVARPPN
jgi:hypothetical protein